MKNFMMAIIAVWAIATGNAADGPDDALVGRILEITGAERVEDLDEETFSEFENLARNPVRINFASRSRLRSCGLFSNYQIASLLDYIERTGEIRSFAEMSLVDGFSGTFVDRIRPFVSVEYADGKAGKRDQDIRGAAAAKADLKNGGIHINASLGETLDFNFGSGKIGWENALKSIAGRIEEEDPGGGKIEWDASELTGSLRWSGKKISITAGDFNVAFGQGLTLWTGFTMSGASSVKFDRNATGTRPGTGFGRSSRIRGLAAGWDSGKFSADIIAGINGEIGANTTMRFKSFQIGATGYHEKGSTVAGVDTKFNFSKIDFYSEAAFDFVNKAPAILAGTSYSPAYLTKFSLLGRWYPTEFKSTRAGAFRSSTKPSDETGISAAAQFRKLTITADAAYHPLKSQHHFKAILNFSPEWNVGGHSFKPELKITERYRPNDALKHRTELRIGASLNSDKLENTILTDIVHSRNWGYMISCESKYKTNKLSLAAKLTCFMADSWDDRIYSWQRDVPGTFNVKALYGRGWIVSLYASYNKTYYLRAAVTSYPGNPQKNVLEIRLEYVKDFFHRRSP